EEVEAFIEFDEDGCGSFEFGEIHGFIAHYRTKKKDRQRAIHFDWHGEDEEGMPMDDIGWALLEDGELQGTISLNAGEEEVQFMAKRESPKTPAKTKQRRTKDKPRAKLGKSSASVKTRLKQLEQRDAAWEADSTAVEKVFPAVAKWVNGYGHIEIGDQDGFGFIARALDYGGLVFEDETPKTFAEAMAVLEKGLADWFENEGVEA
ncbi:MAG TPA: hypothetical protein VFE62_00670, partial [Gemmataceae bacterium]|nr:hypothetical protein [Gemmataceae bacterium]